MNALTLSQLCAKIEEAVETELEPTYWVQAEISSLSTRSGHAYFDLVEKATSGQLSAKIRATCWANVYGMLLQYFVSETGTEPQVGMQVLVEVSVEFHPLYGLSLNIANIDPTYTIGELARQRQRTIQRLQEEGVFDLQKSLTLPTLPCHLAIVSSHQAAGYEDFVNQLQQSGFGFSATLFPAIMQGDNAPTSILQALQQIADEYEKFDAVILIRGGGATIDLGCFDDYNLACHCAQFPLPILCGIGHTRDISIVDMVAHKSFKTPTAVAAFLIDCFAVQQEYIDQLRLRLRQTAERQIMLRRHLIELLRQSVELQSPERIYQKGYSLLTTTDGQVISSIHKVKSGTHIVTHLRDGSIQSIAQ